MRRRCRQQRNSLPLSEPTVFGTPDTGTADVMGPPWHSGGSEDRIVRRAMNQVGAALVLRFILAWMIGLVSLSLPQLIKSLVPPVISVVSSMTELDAYFWLDHLLQRPEIIILTEMLQYVLLNFVPFYLLFKPKEKGGMRFCKRFGGNVAPYTLTYAVIALAFTLCINFFSQSIGQGISEFLPGFSFVPSAAQNDTGVRGVLPFALRFLYLALLAPFVEEMVFRGLLLQKLLPFGPVFAILSSSLVFGIVHATMVQFVYATCLGIFYAVLALKTQSLKTGLVLHILQNSMAVLLELVPPAPQNIVAAVVLLAGFVLLVRLLGRSKEGDSQTFDGIPQGRPQPSIALFFSPVMCFALAICALNMAALFLL